jgi:cell division topological specificity factor
LMTDHLALAPEIIDNMKRDLVDVISRYVEVDREKVEVNFEREDRALAMLANIPIVSVNRPSPPPAPPPVAPVDKSAAGPPPQRKRRRKKPAAQNPAAAH